MTRTIARHKHAPRRTQQERREGTIRKLLDATTDALIEVGYSRTTVQEICNRAGVSQGGLFRHFPTHEALMVKVGEDVGRRILAQYRSDFDSLKTREEPLVLAIRLVREHCRSRLNHAWFELAVAARTNDGLRAALRPSVAQYFSDIEALARELLPDLAERLGPRFPALVDTIIAVFDGEVVHHSVIRRPATEKARLELLSMFARLFASA